MSASVAGQFCIAQLCGCADDIAEVSSCKCKCCAHQGPECSTSDFHAAAGAGHDGVLRGQRPGARAHVLVLPGVGDRPLARLLQPPGELQTLHPAACRAPMCLHMCSFQNRHVKPGLSAHAPALSFSRPRLVAGGCPLVQGPVILVEMVVQRLIRKSGWQVTKQSRLVSPTPLLALCKCCIDVHASTCLTKHQRSANQRDMCCISGAKVGEDCRNAICPHGPGPHLLLSAPSSKRLGRPSHRLHQSGWIEHAHWPLLFMLQQPPCDQRVITYCDDVRSASSHMLQESFSALFERLTQHSR